VAASSWSPVRRINGYEEREPATAVADLEKSLGRRFSCTTAGRRPRQRWPHPPRAGKPSCRWRPFIAYLQNPRPDRPNRPDKQQPHRGRRRRCRAPRLRAISSCCCRRKIPLFLHGARKRICVAPSCSFTDLPEPLSHRPSAGARYWQMAHVLPDQRRAGKACPTRRRPKPSPSLSSIGTPYGRPEHRAALDRFKQLASLRRELDLAADGKPNASPPRSARQGSGVIVTWQYRDPARTT